MAKKSKRKLKEDQAGQIQMFYQQFTRAETGNANLRKKWAVLDKFDRGEQWDDAALPPWVAKPVTNFIRYVRTMKRANLASAIPMSHYHAEYEEDQSWVDNLYAGYRHVWDKEKIPRIIRRCVDRALIQGTAIGYVYSDDDYVGGKYYKKDDVRNALYNGKICVKRIPNANFFIDPDAYCIDDAKWAEYTEILPITTVVNTPAYVEYCKEHGFDISEVEKLEPSHSDDEDGTIYGRETTPNNNQNEDGYKTVTVHTRFRRKRMPGGKYRMDCFYYIPDMQFFLLHVEDMKPNEYYPFAVLYDEEEENSFWGTSTCMDFLENQKIINKTQQTYSIIATMHQNPQKIVSRESGIDPKEVSRSGTLPGKTYTANGDPTRSMYVMPPGDIPRGLYEVDDRTQNHIKEMAGINEAYTGQSVGSLTTSSGVNQLIERATIRDKDKMIQIDAFVERLSELIILHIMHKWKEERAVSYKGPDGRMVYGKYTPIEDDIAENLEWRVHSDIYASSAITQQQRRQQADHLLQLQGQFQFEPAVITPEEYIQMWEYDMTPEMKNRMTRDRRRLATEKPEQMSQIIMQAAQMIQQGLSQGLPMAEVQNQAHQMAMQILVEQKKAELQGRKADTAAQPNAPKGRTGQMAMRNMAQGS